MVLTLRIEMGDLPTYDDVTDAGKKATVPHFPAIQSALGRFCSRRRSTAVHGGACAVSDRLVLLGLEYSNSSQKAS